MPDVTARFAADFTPFTEAIKKAEVTLKGLETGSGRVQSSLNRMTDSLSGRKLIQDAMLMAEAVEQIGGAANLTDKELQKVATRAAEASEKMRALGLAVPTNLQNLAAQARSSESALSAFSSQAVKWAAGLISVDAALRLASGAFDLAGKAASEFLDIVLEGSGVGDVAENFERLAGAAGLVGDELLGAMRAGTQGTIRNFELMQTASTAMAAGLNLTADQFRLLSQGAFALAQATGGSVTEALNTMTEALVTGKTKAIEKRFGMIDLQKAEEDYARSLGTTRDMLTEEGRLHAQRTAILDTVGAAVGRLGNQQAGLDERLAQARAAWQNFRDELGRSIAASPVLEAALLAIGRELGKAFGTDQKTAIATITRAVEDLAIKGVDLGKTLVDVGAYIAKSWVGVETKFLQVKLVMAGLSALGARVSGDTAAWESLTGVVKDTWAELGNVDDRFAQIDANAASAKGALDRIGEAMRGAAAASRDNAAATTTAAGARAALNAATGASTAALGANTGALAGNTAGHVNREAQLKKMADADAKAIEALQRERALLDAMEAALHPATAATTQFTEAQRAEIAALTQAGFSIEQIAQRFGVLPVVIKQAVAEWKQLNAAAAATQRLQTDYDAMVAAGTGTRVDQQIAEVNRWVEHTRQTLDQQGIWTQKADDLIVASAQLRIDRIMGLDVQLTENTKRAVEQRAVIERNQLESMMREWEQWGDVAIREQEQVALAAEQAARDFGIAWDPTIDVTRAGVEEAVAGMEETFTQFGVTVVGATEGAAKAMSRAFMDNGVLVVGAAQDTADGIERAHSEAAEKVTLTWSEAMQKVREGEGTMTGTVQSGGMTKYGPWGSPEHLGAVTKAAAAGRYFGPSLKGNLPALSQGGTVQPHQAYVVGEKGPEVFVPDIAGTVLPNSRGLGGTAPGTTSMQNTFYINGTGEQVARRVLEEITRMMRTQRKWPTA